MSTVIIAGSARTDGDTQDLVDRIIRDTGWDAIDLNDYDISYYDYEHANRDDDFIPVMRNLIDDYSTFLFVTPVYWYSMSGIMKVFFDRMTDLITIEKDLGRRLRTKNMAVASTSNGNHLKEWFWLPFVETARYLGIEYLGSLHSVSGEDNREKIQQFTASILDQKVEIEP